MHVIKRVKKKEKMSLIFKQLKGEKREKRKKERKREVRKKKLQFFLLYQLIKQR
jgi:hypothetical protein